MFLIRAKNHILKVYDFSVKGVLDIRKMLQQRKLITETDLSIFAFLCIPNDLAS